MNNTLKKHSNGLHENRTFGEVLVQRGNSWESLDLANAHDGLRPAFAHLSGYGWGKLLGERELEYAAVEGFPMRVAVLRLTGVYGENQDTDLATGSAIPDFIRRAIEYPARRPFVVLGTGGETRSCCYIEDVIDALVVAAEQLERKAFIGPLNVGSEKPITIRDLVRTIIEISGKPIEPVHDASRPTAIWGQELDCSRARQLLDGWHPKISLEEGLRRVYKHMLQQLSGGFPA